MIFQKDQGADYISKIRLTGGFRGKLPNGSIVDLGNLRLKDVFTMYPSLKDKWGSRDCSGFWSFSNDTIAFYVRVDTAKKPKYPSMKPTIWIGPWMASILSSPVMVFSIRSTGCPCSLLVNLPISCDRPGGKRRQQWSH